MVDAKLDQVVRAIAEAACVELDGALASIEHCLAQLDDDRVWRRPDDSMNSIANLMLHLSGNVGQWIVSGVGGVADTRNRPAEFSARRPQPKQEVRDQLQQTVERAKVAIQSASADDLLARRTIQGFDVTGMQAILESVAHFRGHTQEIIHITRCQLGNAYQFSFVPATPEQGA